jgi:hypothetical protein
VRKRCRSSSLTSLREAADSASHSATRSTSEQARRNTVVVKKVLTIFITVFELALPALALPIKNRLIF